MLLFFFNGLTALPGVRRIRPCCDALFLHGTQPRFGSQKASVVWFYLRGSGATHRDGVCAEQRKGPPETSGTGLDQLTTHSFIKTTAAEARELGWGGISFVARATGLSRPTITAGLRELDQPSVQRAAEVARVRRPGGGRRPLTETDLGLRAALESLVEPGTRGHPGTRSGRCHARPGRTIRSGSCLGGGSRRFA